MFEKLDEIMASGNKKSDSDFNIENDRLTVKTKWIKISDKVDVGYNILKIVNLSSVDVGKYFLKITVNLQSDFEQLLQKLEHENQVLKGKCDWKNEEHSEVTARSSTVNDDIIPKDVKEKGHSLKLLKNSSDGDGYDDLDIINFEVEEYIPTPSTATIASEDIPTYHPEKNSAQIEINQIQSQYSPTYVNADKSPNETASYRPSRTRRQTKLFENGDSKRSHVKKTRTRPRSVDLFGLSDDDEVGEGVSSSSHLHHTPKRKMESNPTKVSTSRKVSRKESSSGKESTSRNESSSGKESISRKESTSRKKSTSRNESSSGKETKSSKDTKETKKKARVSDTASDQDSFTKIGDITIR